MSEAGGPGFHELNNIYLKHPLIEPYLGKVEVKNLAMSQLGEDGKSRLESAVKVFEPYHKVEIKPERMLKYQAAVVSPRIKSGEEKAEVSDDNTVGLVYLSGASSMAGTYGHVAMKLFNEMEENLPWKPKLSAVIGSSGGIDVLNEKWWVDVGRKHFPFDIAERAAYQAEFIFRILKENPSKKIFLVAHSLGGMEVNYVLPILEKLLEIEKAKEKDGMLAKLDTKVAGLVLFQPGGIIDQNPIEMLKGASEFLSLARGIREMWPSPDDLVQAEEALEDAKIKGDPAEEFRLKQLILEMKRKKDNPQNLTKEERIKLEGIDKSISGSSSGKEKEELMKKRYELLFPALKRISGTDVSRERMSEIWPSPMDILKVKEEIEKAITDSDQSRASLLKYQLAEMEKGQKNPQYLSEEDKKALQAIDQGIIQATDRKVKERLLKKREVLLFRRIPWSPGKDLLALATKFLPAVGFDIFKLHKILPEWRVEVSKPRPKWLREQVAVPAAYLWGKGIKKIDKGDVFFPGEKAEKQMKEGYFPRAPVVIEGTVNKFPHEGLVSNIDKFSWIISNIMGRMIEAEERGYPQKKIELHF